MVKHQGAKVAFIDLENSPIIGAVWEMWEADVLWVEQDWYLYSYSVKWLDGKQKTLALTDFPKTFKKNCHDDSALIKSLWQVFDEADIVVAHNGNAFDIKKANARFMHHKLKPYSPFASVDTLSEARKRFKFSSNKLDSVCQALGIGSKVVNTGKDLWKRCWWGDKAAFKEMKVYNAHDVYLLEQLYLYLRPWMNQHPNLRLFDRKDGCPNCGSTKLQKRGVYHLVSHDKEKWTCMGCGKWFAGKIIKKA
jgi:DNA polymerase elongation subunit (family B)